jgi:hypothetical protein
VPDLRVCCRDGLVQAVEVQARLREDECRLGTAVSDASAVALPDAREDAAREQQDADAEKLAAQAQDVLVQGEVRRNLKPRASRERYTPDVVLFVERSCAVALR